MKRLSLVLVMLALGAAAIMAAGSVQETESDGWRPNKPVTIVVPWGAGGSTDQVTRVLAGELEGPLG